MELDPEHVARVARAWDEQHLEVAAAGRRIGGASGQGFSPAVAGAATRFATGWGRATADMGDRCESEADSMRTAVRLALESDGTSAADLGTVLDSIAELR